MGNRLTEAHVFKPRNQLSELEPSLLQPPISSLRFPTCPKRSPPSPSVSVPPHFTSAIQVACRPQGRQWLWGRGTRRPCPRIAGHMFSRSPQSKGRRAAPGKGSGWGRRGTRSRGPRRGSEGSLGEGPARPGRTGLPDREGSWACLAEEKATSASRAVK